MTHVKRILSALISATLMLFVIVATNPSAHADGQNQIASHLDWSGVNLSVISSISQSFTPLSVPSPSEGQVDWSLNVGNSTSALSTSLILLNNGSVVWQFIDVPAGSRVMNVDTARCNLQSGNAFGTPNSFRSICTAPLQAVAGETYTFDVKFWDNNGSKWWTASVSIKSTGQIIQLGRLENNASNDVLNTSTYMSAYNQTSFYKVPLPACSDVPNYSIIYGPLKNSGVIQPANTGNRGSSACPGIDRYDLSTPGKYQLNIGSKTTGTATSGRMTASEGQPENTSLRQNWFGGYLNSSKYIEQEFTPLQLPTVNKNQGTAESIQFAWQWKNTNSFTGQPVGGFTDLEIVHSSSNINTATFTFVLWDGVDVSNSYDTQNCEKRVLPVAQHARSDTFYIVCYRSITIEHGVTYSIRVEQDTQKGANWWKSTLTNMTTNQSVTIGSIKATENDINSPLFALWSNMIYTGSPVACDAVPVLDLVVSPIRNSPTSKLTLGDTILPQCANATVVANKGKLGGYVFKYGGTNPAARNLEGAPLVSEPSPTPKATSKAVVVNKPTFSLINIVGNKLNVSVNLGTAGSSRPDSVYLVAPKLGILDSNKLLGNISGSKASWSIDFDKLLSGTAIPLKVVGVKNGVESDPEEQSFSAPDASKLVANKTAPLAPKNVKSRVVGTSAVITAESTIKVGALATSAYIFGTALGVPASQAILGEVIGNKVLFEVPLKSSMAGKTFPFTIFLANETGKSQPVQGKLTVPSAPKIPSGSIKLPTQTKAPKTIFCVKGSQTRTFAAKACPPGWKTA